MVNNLARALRSAAARPPLVRRPDLRTLFFSTYSVHCNVRRTNRVGVGHGGGRATTRRSARPVHRVPSIRPVRWRSGGRLQQRRGTPRSAAALGAGQRTGHRCLDGPRHGAARPFHVPGGWSCRVASACAVGRVGGGCVRGDLPRDGRSACACGLAECAGRAGRLPFGVRTRGPRAVHRAPAVRLHRRPRPATRLARHIGPRRCGRPCGGRCPPTAGPSAGPRIRSNGERTARPSPGRARQGRRQTHPGVVGRRRRPGGPVCVPRIPA